MLSDSQNILILCVNSLQLDQARQNVNGCKLLM